MRQFFLHLRQTFKKTTELELFGLNPGKRLEPEHHLFEKENHLNQTVIFWVPNVNYQGCIVTSTQNCAF